MSQSDSNQNDVPKLKSYDPNLLFDSTTSLSKHKFFEFQFEEMNKIEANSKLVHDRNDSNFSKATNFKDKILHGSIYGVRQQHDYVIDTYVMAPIYYTETIKYNSIDISVRWSRRIQNLPKLNYGTTIQKKNPITKYFCEQCNYFHKKKQCKKKQVPYYCEKYDDFRVQKKYDKCANFLMEPEDFDETLLDSSSKSSYGSDQTYYEPDTKDFVIRDRFKYIHSQNGIILEDSQLYFSDNELMIDDSSSSNTYSLRLKENIIIESILNKFKLRRYTKRRRVEESAASSPSPDIVPEPDNIEEEGTLEN
ncbi:27719_t:CDS:2 [Racocetra persica]|uniref:27719_t:CDS:1 n=1 Tax=Racocetra persica TaxID=160502 RepID=A0ACA9P7P2_9GLOM|nr:27719_t:CDS:2 [Racocetra persica]